MKLVRDGIPADMRARGYEPELVFVQHPEVLRDHLLQKLMEECQEVLASGGKDASELGDVWDVLTALNMVGTILGDIPVDTNFIRLAAEKSAKFGGFMKGTLWINSDDASTEAHSARRGYAESGPSNTPPMEVEVDP